jgi:hypothetical protein
MDSEIQFKFWRKKCSCERSIWAIDLDMFGVSKRSKLDEHMFLAHRSMLAGL